MNTAAATAAHFLRQAVAFCDKLISRPELLRRIFPGVSSRKIDFSGQCPALSNLHLATQALGKAFLSDNPDAKSPSLRLAEKLARLSTDGKPYTPTFPSDRNPYTPVACGAVNPYIPAIASLLLALISSLRQQPHEAALYILDIFVLDPSAARSEIVPLLWEENFLVYFLPVLHWFKDQRTRILSSILPENRNGGSSFSFSGEIMAFDELACKNLLSKMSRDQAIELQELECVYEGVLDENTRAYAQYLKAILEDVGENRRTVAVPELVLPGIRRERGYRAVDDAKVGSSKLEMTEQVGLRNGRYNPVWEEAEKSIEIYSSSSSNGNRSRKCPALFPQRVAPDLFRKPKSNIKNRSSKSISDSESDLPSASHSSPSIEGFLCSSGSSFCCFDSEHEGEEKSQKMALFQLNQSKFRKQRTHQSAESSGSPGLFMADSENGSASGNSIPKQSPPKDFVCPITSQIYTDPVTLETGQTYERKAIQEWLDRGNLTCPITRQKLQSTQLPKTNYVLKRLIASWKEQKSGLVSEFKNLVFPPGMGIQIQSEKEAPKRSFNNPVRPSSSPTSVISQATVDGIISELRPAINHLCTSEVLSESEAAVLKIKQAWQESKAELDIQVMLTKPAITNGFVEILFNSVDPRVLSATVYLLSELAVRDNSVVTTLTRVDSDVECIVALLKKGLREASVLIYLLRPSLISFVEMDFIKALLMVITGSSDEIAVEQGAHLKMCVRPKTASVILLGQIMRVTEDGFINVVARTIILEGAVGSLVGSLESELVEERIAAVGILLRCIEEDGNCRNEIADKAELAYVLESFVGGSDGEQFEIVQFLSELVKLNRRTFNEQLLQIIKDEGAFSTMHTLLIFLQTALQDQCPAIASLLLQLDLLAEPRKMSMYREEAIDALISCLRNTDFPGTQIAAAEAIVALPGRFSSSGKPLTRAFLLKLAGIDKNYRAVMRAEKQDYAFGESQERLEEEKAANEWERKMAFVLVSHEFGLLFEALSEGLKSSYAELSSACFLGATWLMHMLTILPDTGIRGAARHCLLQRFISIFKSARDIDDKALAMLALSSFINDSEGLQDIISHRKDIMRILRELKKSSTLAAEMLKVFSNGQDSSDQDLWNHKELVQVDCSANGEVLSIICFKHRIFSGHSDGTLKVWSGKGSLLHLIQETREHLKSVTSLAILQSGEKLYSGSLDRTVRVWSVGTEEIHCLQVHDMKDQIHCLSVANTIACFIPQGAGVKVHSWNGSSKLFNTNKHVRCLSMLQGKLYCGCNDSSIQEIDLVTGTSSTIQSGSRKLLGKAMPIYALEIDDGLLYSASSPLDGVAVKIWRTSNYSMVGSLASSAEVRSMAVSSELIYLGCKMGSIEIWSKEKLSRVGTLQIGTSSKVSSMALDANGDVLITGTADGLIQAWGLT